MNNYKVYCIKHIIDNTIKYVEITRQSLLQRWYAHCLEFKFNKNHYRMELIVEDLTLEQATTLETMLIKQYNLLETGWNKNSEKHKQALIKNKKRRVLCLNTGEIFDSNRKAAKKYNLQRSKVSDVCHGKRLHTRGYRFIFINDEKSG